MLIVHHTQLYYWLNNNMPLFLETCTFLFQVLIHHWRIYWGKNVKFMLFLLRGLLQWCLCIPKMQEFSWNELASVKVLASHSQLLLVLRTHMALKIYELIIRVNIKVFPYVMSLMQEWLFTSTHDIV